MTRVAAGILEPSVEHHTGSSSRHARNIGVFGFDIGLDEKEVGIFWQPGASLEHSWEMDLSSELIGDVDGIVARQDAKLKLEAARASHVELSLAGPT
jgi:hypothetical protein